MHPFFKSRRRLTASPEATPYQRAGQVWDDRMGLSIAHARNWRRIALANLGLAAFLGAGWWFQADRAIVRPFVVEVAEWGQTQKITALDGRYEPTQSDGGVQTFDRFGLEPDVAANVVASFTTVHAVWQGDRPVLRARRGPGERYDWYRLNGTGAVNLSGRLSTAPVRMDGLQGDDLIAIADGQAWRLPATGQAVALGGATGVQPFAPFGVLTAPRDRLNTPGAGPLLAVDPRGRLLPVTSPWRAAAPADPDVLVHPVTGSSAWAVEETERNGVRSLQLRGPAGRVRTLATLNA